MKRGLLAIAIAMAVISMASALPTDEGPKEITVKEKWTKQVGNSGLYLFSDTDDNVYSIQDTWWHLDFSAANRYTLIQPGQTYKMWFFGLRVPLFSWYQNAYRIEEI